MYKLFAMKLIKQMLTNVYYRNIYYFWWGEIAKGKKPKQY